MNFRPSFSTLLIAFAAITLLTISSCKKEEEILVPAPPGNEFITTASITATNSADTTDILVVRWIDLTPGDAVGPTQIDTLKLRANAIYTCKISLLDETILPAGDIGEDISERRNYHIFCFSSTGLSGFSMVATDLDTNTPALPFGMENKIITGAAGNGSIEVALKHQPNVKDGSCTPGSVDFNVVYPVIVFN